MWLNGTNSILEALKRNSAGALYIHRQHKSFLLITSLAKKNHCSIHIVSKEELKQKDARQGVLFETSSLPNTYIPNLKKWLDALPQDRACLVLLLDHVLDPQNLGAIIRSASLFDVDLLIQAQKRNAPENAVSARSASGGLSVLPRCYENNFSQALELLKEKNFWVYALDMDGKNLTNIELSTRCVFVLGGEHKGVSQLLKKHSDEIVSIPNNKSLDSFNVSVSAAIAAYEYTRQHGINKS